MVAEVERRGCRRENEGEAEAEGARPKTRSGRATGLRAATGQEAGQDRRGTRTGHTGARGGGKARGADRSCLEEQAAERVRQIQAATAEAGLWNRKPPADNKR